MDYTQKLVLRNAIETFRQNYIYQDNKYFLNGFIMHSPPNRNPFYTLLDCELFEVDLAQVRTNSSLIRNVNIKSIIHVCLDATYTDFLKSRSTKYMIDDYFNTDDIESSVLDLYKLGDLLKIEQVSNFHIKGRKFGTTYFDLVHNEMIVNCKMDPFDFCKNKLTTTIANIKQNVNLMNEVDINNYWSSLSQFATPIMSSKIILSESHLPKLKQISRIKFKDVPVRDDEIAHVRNLISSINDCSYPVNNPKFEYKLTFKGMTLIVPTWKKNNNNGIVLPGIRKRLILSNANLLGLLQYLKITKTYDSAISKLESIKLTLT